MASKDVEYQMQHAELISDALILMSGRHAIHVVANQGKVSPAEIARIRRLSGGWKKALGYGREYLESDQYCPFSEERLETWERQYGELMNLVD